MTRTLIILEKASLIKPLRAALGSSYEYKALSGHFMTPNYPLEIQKTPWSKIDIKYLVTQPIEYQPLSPKFYKDLSKTLKEKWTQVVIATDPDVQGNFMGLLLTNLNPKLNYTRINLETLEPAGIKKSFDERVTFERNTGFQGQIKSRVDYLVGTVFSRYASLRHYNQKKIWKTLTVGRVQTPTLNFVKTREKEIKDFTPEVKNRAYLGEIKTPWFMEEGQSLEVKVNISPLKIKIVNSFPGLNTDQLVLKLSTSPLYKKGETIMSDLEDLYLKGIISYPRTDNNSYANYPELLKKSLEIFEVYYSSKPVTPKLKPLKSTDHGPITLLDLSEDGFSKGQSLIKKTLLEQLSKSFSGDNSYDQYLVTTEHPELGVFKYHWLKIKEKVFEDGVTSYNSTPEFSPILKILKETSRPPSRYTFTTLFKKMVSEKIGTKSTRGVIIDNLVARGYLTMAENLKPSPWVDVLWAYLEPKLSFLTSPEFTRDLEQRAKLMVLKKDLEEVQKSYRVKFLESL